MYVGRRMSPNPITATPETSHSQAVQLMREHNIRHLPIIDKGRLVGIVVEEDLLSTQPSPATTLSIYEIYSLLDRLKLKDVMTSPVVAVQEDTPLEEAARVMLDHKFSGVPVVRGDELVGIITEIDIFRAFVEVLGVEEQGLVLNVRLEDRPGALATVAKAIAQAGGNIRHIVPFRNPEENSGEIYMKVVGADQAELERLIREEAAADLLNIHPVQHQVPRSFGYK